jgi:hypothetical protein
MNKRDYIGKIVISAKTKNRFLLTKIHAAYIGVGSEDLNGYGTRSSYIYKTDNGDPFTSGDLYFQDATLTERFKKEYNDYCRSEDGRSEAWLYWMQTCD